MFAIGWAIYKLTIQFHRGEARLDVRAADVRARAGARGRDGRDLGDNVHASTPAYFAESFRPGAFFLPKAQVYGCVLAVVVLTALCAAPLHLARPGDPRRRHEPRRPRELVGVNPKTVAALTFAIGVAATGAGGSIIGVLYPFLPGSHYQWISRLLAIVVLGGMGSIGAPSSAALVLGIAETPHRPLHLAAWATAVPYVLVFVVLLARPQGLLGARLREDAVA